MYVHEVSSLESTLGPLIWMAKEREREKAKAVEPLQRLYDVWRQQEVIVFD